MYWTCSPAKQSFIFLSPTAFSQPPVMILFLKVNSMSVTDQDLLYRSQCRWQCQNKKQMVLLLHGLRSLCSTCKRCLNSYKTVTVPTYMRMNYLTARHFCLLRGKAEFKYVCVFIFSFMVFPLKRAAVIQGRRGQWGRNACDINRF